MKSPRYFAQLQGARVLDAIRTNGGITQDQATVLGVRRLAAVVYRLRKAGWGLTDWIVTSPTGTKVAQYKFTERQQAQPATPVYPGPAPRESRFRH